MGTCICMAEALCCPPEIITTLFIGYISIQNKKLFCFLKKKSWVGWRPDSEKCSSRRSLDSCCSVAQLCPTLCNSADCSTPSLPVLHHLLELVQTYVHWVSDAIQPSHPLSCSSPPALNLSQHQGLFQSVGSSHQVAKVLELQLQHPSFQRIFRIDCL